MVRKFVEREGPKVFENFEKIRVIEPRDLVY